MLKYTDITPITAPKQFAARQVGIALEGVSALIRVVEARNHFNVNGAGLTAAVADTGLRTTHVDFAGRVVAQRNFTADNGDNVDDATDGNGHGTNVGGIICASADHMGVAPGANIAPLKVLTNAGGGSFQAVTDALAWVLENQSQHNISVVCMSLGAGNNVQDDSDLAGDELVEKIAELREVSVPVVIASGNDFFTHNSKQGMSYPSIIRQCISVGAVYDDDEGDFSYSSGAKAFATDRDRITPFSQRLHPKVHEECRTDIFAPGAPVTSAGIQNDHGESIQHGTSQATPVVAGVILLMQRQHKDLTGNLPSVAQLIDWMRANAVSINDGDDENDNVQNTGLDFLRIDAFAALDTVRRSLQKQMFLTGRALR